MSAVTQSVKCYVFVCVGCNKLADTERNDTLTCSTRCRVRAHRNGSLQTLRALATSMEIRPAMILQAKAIRLLRPELEAEVLAGRLNIVEAQPAVYSALIKRLLPAARSSTASEAPVGTAPAAITPLIQPVMVSNAL